MATSIVNYWRRLEGPLHPDDKAVFDVHYHSFNLNFPPPAFIGDVENAPVVLLEANGGYDPVVTPSLPSSERLNASLICSTTPDL